MRCGLLGRTLEHSYSPMIHSLLADYRYDLFPTEPEALDGFLRGGDWDGLNVTIPYKKVALPYCTALSDTAEKLGSVNTLVRRTDGSIFGANTDYDGFRHMVRRSGIPVAGKKALVLGSGGASVTVCAVLRDLGAASVTVISRGGPDNYENLEKHADAQLIANTTPLGMYPNTGAAAVDLTRFPHCEGVFDIVYNPARTALLLQAETLGVPCAGGLSMLVAQARRSAELFTGAAIPDGTLESVEQAVRARLENIVLIGMPGCGKSTVAKALGAALGREVAECDAWIEAQAGCTIPEIFARGGEAEFRRLETEALRELGKRSGVILSTGGGCVTRAENYPLMHQNGTIFWLLRDLSSLPSKGRPLSQRESAESMFARREPLYARFADVKINNDRPLADTVEEIRRYLG